MEENIANVFASSSRTDYDYFDRLRDSVKRGRHKIVQAPDSSSSTVIEVDDEGTELRLMHVAGIFGFSNAGKPRFSSFDQAKSALMAQYHFNNRIGAVIPNLDNLLTRPDGSKCNLKLTMDFYDTERNAARGTAVLVEHIHAREFPYETTAIIGAQRSAVSSPLAVLNTARHIPQISHGSTSTRLDDRGVYGSFGRVIPSSAGDAYAAMAYFRQVMKSTHLGILHVNDNYGSTYRIELEKAARQAGIETKAVSFDVTNTADTTELKKSIAQAADFLAQTGFHHFMGIIFMSQLEPLLEIGAERGIMGPGNVWLFGDGISSDTIRSWSFPVDSPQAIALHGSGVLNIGAPKTRESYKRFITAFEREESNPEFRQYFASKSPLATNVVEFEANYTASGPNELIYDAVMALGIGGCNSASSFFTGDDLYAEFLKSDFEGASGTVHIDSFTGGRSYTTATYVVHNTQVQESQINDGRTQHEVVLTSEFSRIANGDEFVETRWINANNEQFLYSDSTTTPPPPLPPREIEDIISPGTLSWVAGFAFLIMLASVGFAVWTIQHRRSHIVKVSQPSFLLCICAGEFLMACAVVGSGLINPSIDYQVTRFSCMAPVWLFGFGFSFVFGALYTKTLRIHKILGHGKQFRRVRVEVKDVALPGILLLLTVLLILFAWQVIDPLRYELVFDESGTLDVYGRPLHVASTCVSDKESVDYFSSALCLVMLITMIGANSEAYKARHITTEYSESTFIALSTAANLQGLVLALPVFLFQSDPQTTFIAKSCLALLIASTTLALIFVPKVWNRREHERLKRQRAEQKSMRLAASARLLTGLDEFHHYASESVDSQLAISVRSADSGYLHHGDKSIPAISLAIVKEDDESNASVEDPTDQGSPASENDEFGVYALI